MDFQEWFRLFYQQILNTSLIEWLAVGFGASEVLLAKKNSISIKLIAPMNVRGELLNAVKPVIEKSYTLQLRK